MNLIFALAVAALFGLGAYLLLNRDLVRVVLGVVIVSQSAVLTLMASAIVRGDAPIYPLARGPISDPLSQAMALTAIVIGMAVTALLLALVLCVALAFQSRAMAELAETEAERDERLERRHAPEQESEEVAAR
ncbi:MAG TPA: NADH-quinone oxidoreductase subunit K [Candidatus Limnocylindrales bacterium]|nr:NADH-quinone oxidoreductase subunit K [Candidatus Limnocylindrales bacterium]